MNKIITIYALGLYFLLLIVSTMVTYLFWLSEKYKPNFMIKATMYLLVTLTMSIFGILILRMATQFELLWIHYNRNWFLLIPRTLMLMALLNFLKQTVKKK